jgi:hypothetical protein
MPKTPETPPFSIVAGETTVVSPPRALGPHGTALWNRVMAEYRIADCGGLELLCQACQALDRAEALAEAIARDGAVIYSRAGIPRAHPAVRDELQARAFVVKTIEKLGINFEAVKPPGRPPSPIGWSPRVA